MDYVIRKIGKKPQTEALCKAKQEAQQKLCL